MSKKTEQTEDEEKKNEKQLQEDLKYLERYEGSNGLIKKYEQNVQKINEGFKNYIYNNYKFINCEIKSNIQYKELHTYIENELKSINYIIEELNQHLFYLNEKKKIYIKIIDNNEAVTNFVTGFGILLGVIPGLIFGAISKSKQRKYEDFLYLLNNIIQNINIILNKSIKTKEFINNKKYELQLVNNNKINIKEFPLKIQKNSELKVEHFHYNYSPNNNINKSNNIYENINQSKNYYKGNKGHIFNQVIKSHGNYHLSQEQNNDNIYFSKNEPKIQTFKTKYNNQSFNINVKQKSINKNISNSIGYNNENYQYYNTNYNNNHLNYINDSSNEISQLSNNIKILPVSYLPIKVNPPIEVNQIDDLNLYSSTSDSLNYIEEYIINEEQKYYADNILNDDK